MSVEGRLPPLGGGRPLAFGLVAHGREAPFTLVYGAYVAVSCAKGGMGHRSCRRWLYRRYWHAFCGSTPQVCAGMPDQADVQLIKDFLRQA